MKIFVSCLFMLSLMLFLPACAGIGFPASSSTTTSTTGSNPQPTLSTLHAVTFSIGKADATLIYHEDFAVLIDAGEEEDAAEILLYMSRKGIRELDALILTHYDKDHVGGADGILRGIPVKAVYGTYPSKESEEYDQYLAALSELQITPSVLREETQLSFGNAIFRIYPPAAESYAEKESNNSSLVLHLTYGQTRFLFAADAEEARIAELLSMPREKLACDLMKVPYHGNDLANLDQLLALATPHYGIITCSDKNPEEQGKMDTLRQAGVSVFLTRNGNVEFSSNGVSVSVSQ